MLAQRTPPLRAVRSGVAGWVNGSTEWARAPQLAQPERASHSAAPRGSGEVRRAYFRSSCGLRWWTSRARLRIEGAAKCRRDSWPEIERCVIGGAGCGTMHDRVRSTPGESAHPTSTDRWVTVSLSGASMPLMRSLVPVPRTSLWFAQALCAYPVQQLSDQNRLSSIRRVSWCLSHASSRGGKGAWSFKSLSLFWYCSFSLLLSGPWRRPGEP